MPLAPIFYSRFGHAEHVASHFVWVSCQFSGFCILQVSVKTVMSCQDFFWPFFFFCSNGNLQVNITNDKIPSWSPIGLNTSDWRILLPNLYSKFPNDDMIVNLVAEKPPVVIFSQKGGDVSVYGYLTILAVVNGQPTFAFSLNGTVQLSATVAIKGNVNLFLIVLTFSLRRCYSLIATTFILFKKMFCSSFVCPFFKFKLFF